MATPKSTYLGTGPTYRRLPSVRRSTIGEVNISPPSSPIREPSYQQLSESRSRVPSSPLPSSIVQLQDLSARGIKSVRSIDTSAGEGAFRVSKAGLEGFEAIGTSLGKRFFPRTAVDLAAHSQRQSKFTSIPGGSEPPPSQQTGFLSRLFG